MKQNTRYVRSNNLKTCQHFQNKFSFKGYNSKYYFPFFSYIWRDYVIGLNDISIFSRSSLIFKDMMLNILFFFFQINLVKYVSRQMLFLNIYYLIPKSFSRHSFTNLQFRNIYFRIFQSLNQSVSFSKAKKKKNSLILLSFFRLVKNS